MRLQSIFSLGAVIAISFPDMVSSVQVLRRAAAVEVEWPGVGETLVADSDAMYDIRWKNSTSNNVTISLMQGPADNITLLHVIAANTYNNGTYTWRARQDRFLAAPQFSSSKPTSGCNYTLEFRTGGEIITTGYFTILVAQDGGITPNMTCPPEGEPKGRQGSSGGTAQSGNSGNSNTSNGGVSTATLGGAVGGAAAGVLLITILLLFLAKKMGWIMSKRDAEKYITERLQNEESRRFLPHQQQQQPDKVPMADGGQVYQMP